VEISKHSKHSIILLLPKLFYIYLIWNFTMSTMSVINITLWKAYQNKLKGLKSRKWLVNKRSQVRQGGF